VRAFGAVGGTPRFIERGQGAYLVDADGNRLLDLVMSWGALLHGHSNPEVLDAALAAARRGSSFGAPTEAEVELAEAIVAAVPSVERVRLVSSGTEAAMSAIRLARGFTGRSKLLKFAGCYHGHSDALLAESGSGVATFGIPGSAGVTEGAVWDTIVVPYNDLESVRVAFAAAAAQIACVIVEPVAVNMGLVPPDPGFLEGLRDITQADGALLIFDEVMWGFRLGRGGAQERFGIAPDVTVLGKIVGGGYPLAAFGGRGDVMGHLAPEGPVYQAGTLSGNPVAVAAGLAALRMIERDPPYERLEGLGTSLAEGLREVCSQAGVPASVPRQGSLFSVFFGSAGPVRNLADAKAADHARYGAFFHAMLEREVYLPPSGYEGWFLSTAHTDQDAEKVLDAARAAATAGVVATSGS
jgi:glutamate-1-semialdehyde 2,1-aminomutase